MLLSMKFWMTLNMFSISLNSGRFTLSLGLGGRCVTLGIRRGNDLLVGFCHVSLIFHWSYMDLLFLGSLAVNFPMNSFLVLWRTSFVVIVSSANKIFNLHANRWPSENLSKMLNHIFRIRFVFSIYIYSCR